MSKGDRGHLGITIKVGHGFLVGDDIAVIVKRSTSGRVTLAVRAPRSLYIERCDGFGVSTDPKRKLKDEKKILE